MGATEDVARPADRFDEARVRRIGLDHGAKPVDVDIDRPRLARVVVAPDLLEQLVAADDLAGVTEQERQEVEDLRLDREDLAVAEQAVARDVDLDPSQLDHPWERHGSRRWLAAPQHRADA